MEFLKKKNNKKLIEKKMHGATIGNRLRATRRSRDAQMLAAAESVARLSRRHSHQKTIRR